MSNRSLVGGTIFSALLSIVSLLSGCGGGDSGTASPQGKAQLNTIAIAPQYKSLGVGTTEQLAATGIYSDGTRQDISAQVAWIAESAGVVSINKASGLISGTQEGSTVITATLQGKTAKTSITVTDAKLVSIGVTPGNLTLAKGLTQPYHAVGVYTDNSTHDVTAAVTWGISDSTVATISNSAGSKGVATAVNQGSATVTASLGEISGNAVLSATAATLASIEVTPQIGALPAGVVQSLNATGIYSDSSKQDLTAAVTWKSSNVATATVDSNGTLTAVSPGSAAIEASLNDVSVAVSITVNAAALVTIDVTPAASSIAKGLAAQLTATGIYTDHSTHDVTTQVMWSSSDSAIADVSNALGHEGSTVTLSTGSATMSAALGSVSGSMTLTVTAATLVSITVSPANSDVVYGDDLQFAATGTYTDNSTLALTNAVTWSSSDTNTASISNSSGSNGLASAIVEGTTTITAALGTLSASTSATVVPGVVSSIGVILNQALAVPGAVQQATAYATYANGATRNVSKSVTWASSDNSIAAISNAPSSSGLLTAGNVGSTSISATLSGVSAAPVTLTVGNQPAFAYVMNLDKTTISQYSIGANGLLTSLGNNSTANGAWAAAMDPVHHNLYVANRNGGNVSQYSIDLSGNLVKQSSIASPEPFSLSIDPTGQYLYAPNYYSNMLSEYVIGPSGALTLFGTVPYPDYSYPKFTAIDPTGHYLYLVFSSVYQIAEFRIGTGGALASVGSAALSSDTTQVAVDPTGQYVFVTDYSAIHEYRIGPKGGLSFIGNIADYHQGYTLGFDSTGRHLYIVYYGDSVVGHYTIGPGGAATLIDATPTVTSPHSIAFDPAGHYAYITNWNAAGTVQEFSVNGTGHLTAIGSIGTDPSSIEAATIITTY